MKVTEFTQDFRSQQMVQLRTYERNAVMQTYDSKDYLAMPMSTLYLFGRKQDFGFEMAEPIAMVASRHHFPSS